jgi:uncharacterized membrane protein
VAQAPRGAPLNAKRLVWAAAAAYAAAFAGLSVLRDRAGQTGRFDLGNMVQAVWSTAHGHPLRITDLRGDQISRLAAHVDPILVFFAPLWWIWPSASLLLVVQAAALALGALPVFWLARKHLRSDSAALGFALAYLLLPAVEWLTLNEFHPVALATPLLLFAFWYLDESRLIPFAVCAVLACACKEEIPLVVVGFGIWYALSHGRHAVGAAIAALGLVWAGLAIGVIIPHFNNGASSSFYSRYSEVGGSPGGVLKTAATHPWTLVAKAFGHRGIHYLIELGLPLAGLWALAPLALLAAVPDLAINLLSATPTQTSIHFHYVAGIVPALVVASVLGAKRLRQPALAAALAVFAALVGSYLIGPFPSWSALPAPRVSTHDEAVLDAVEVIPNGVVVSASNVLGARLSARRRILSFPYVQDATWIAADEVVPSWADRFAPVPAATELARIRRNPAWRLEFERDGVLVFHRVLPP